MVSVARSPYKYGYITELRASKGFRYDNVKHYSMGRIAHEMGCAPGSSTLHALHQTCVPCLVCCFLLASAPSMHISAIMIEPCCANELAVCCAAMSCPTAAPCT